MKSFVAFLLAMLMFASASAEKVGSMPAPTGYVDDYAGVLSDAGKARIDAICHEIHAKGNAQIFVVTIHTLEDSTIEAFANDLYHNWKIGEKGSDRGVLLIFAINDHKRRIEVGYGLEPILTDGKVGDIGRDMVPALKDGDYDGAILTGVQKVADVIATDAKVTLTPVVATTAATSVQTTTVSDIAIPLLLCFVFGFGLLFIAWRLARRRRSAYGPGYYPNRYNDSYGPGFIGMPGDSSSGSGSDSGFSSSDSSSSSDSFSGGDGGDSGGGGASGDW
jgi:uncharacterized protein